jgi:hypothetical protein
LLDEQSFIEQACVRGKHTLVLYEDAVAAERILFNAIASALRAGKHAIYTTRNDDSVDIIRRMAEAGVPVNEKNELLHVCKIDSPVGHPRGAIEGYKEICNELFLHVKPPFLFVSTLIPEINSKENAESNIMIEADVHKGLGQEFSLLCSYDMNKATYSKHKQWLTSILQSHHDVLFVPRAKIPFGFNMR